MNWNDLRSMKCMHNSLWWIQLKPYYWCPCILFWSGSSLVNIWPIFIPLETSDKGFKRLRFWKIRSVCPFHTPTLTQAPILLVHPWSKFLISISFVCLIFCFKQGKVMVPLLQLSTSISIGCWFSEIFLGVLKTT